MKKLTIWALLATFLVAGAAFAAPAKLVPNASGFDFGLPATTNNDESCDISVMPAATLLLPYFEVSEDRTEDTTIFTITNVSSTSTIAHVVLWTDWSFPVIDFNIYLTPYDVQSINLWDVIFGAVIAPASGSKTAIGTGTSRSPGTDVNEAGATYDFSDCANLPGTVPDFYVTRMQSAFIDGSVASVPGISGSSCGAAGSDDHGPNAIGYATIDVVDLCSTGLPTDGLDYFEDEIRFDNILIGDYAQVHSDNNFAQGNPMVHIKAIPEGSGDTISDGGGFDLSDINWERTFYSRYQPLGGGGVPGIVDRRQPLPSIFAARWIQGGDTDFDTNFKIWREGVTGAGATCSAYATNASLIVTESVMFDEDENGVGIVGDEIIISPPIGADAISTPESALVAVNDSDVFAQFGDGALAGDVAGWVYLNLDNGVVEAALTDPDENVIASQNWVVVSMRAEGRYSVDFDAAALGNGCTPPADVTTFTEGSGVIGPAANDTDCVWNNC